MNRPKHAMPWLTLLVAACFVAGGGGGIASAATITWGSTQNITGDSDVLTTGTLVYAYNFGPSDVPSTTPLCQ